MRLQDHCWGFGARKKFCKMDSEQFTRKIRKATREIHAVSDALVNAKLAFAISNTEVWSEGLLVFYEIFRHLEEAMDRLTNAPVSRLAIEGMRRTEAFEADINFYLGYGWNKNYKPRESVVKYLNHLNDLEKRNPDLLIPYIYLLNMGLMSGGQILRRKREIFTRLNPFSSKNKGGDAVTNFRPFLISKLKRELVRVTNEVAAELSEETRNEILEESKIVFAMNNEVIRTIKGTTQVILRKLMKVSLVLSTILLIVYWFF